MAKGEPYPGFWENLDEPGLIELAYQRLEKYDRHAIREEMRDMIGQLAKDELISFCLEVDYTEEPMEEWDYREVKDVAYDLISYMDKKDMIAALREYGWLDECAKDAIIQSYDDFDDWPTEPPVVVYYDPNQLQFDFMNGY